MLTVDVGGDSRAYGRRSREKRVRRMKQERESQERVYF
jgi:hypothetical protein